MENVTAFRWFSSLAAWIIAALALTGSATAGWPSEVAGIKWEASPAAVKQTMMTKTGVAVENEAPDQISFRGGVSSNMPVKSWQFKFTGGKLTKIVISFVVRQGSDGKGYFANQDFAALQKQFELKYGKVKQGKARPSNDKNFEACEWDFPDDLHPGTLKSIDLYHGWTPGSAGSSHMELTYGPLE